MSLHKLIRPSKIILFSIILSLSISSNSQDFGKGLNLENEKRGKGRIAYRALIKEYQNLPSYKTLKMFTPLPGNQGNKGTCSAWAVTYSALTTLRAINLGWSSEEIIKNKFSPSFTYNLIDTTQSDCIRGISLIDAIESLKDIGTLKNSEFNEECNNLVDTHSKLKAKQNRILDYRELFWRGDPVSMVNSIKTSIYENLPVIIGMEAPFNNLESDLWIPLNEDYENKAPGHALVVIGYDDNKYGGAFELINSWGQNWGNNGFFWIKYEDLSHFAHFGFQLIDFHPVQEFNFSGRIKFIDSENQVIKFYKEKNQLTSENKFSPGTKFQVNIENFQPAYVYALGFEENNSITKLFPVNDQFSPYLPYSQNKIILPSRNHFNELDTSKSDSYYCILYSSRELKINSLISALKNSTGFVKSQLERILSSRLLDSQNVWLNIDNKIDFKAKSSEEDILLLIFRIRSESSQ